MSLYSCSISCGPNQTYCRDCGCADDEARELDKLLRGYVFYSEDGSPVSELEVYSYGYTNYECVPAFSERDTVLTNDVGQFDFSKNLSKNAYYQFSTSLNGERISLGQEHWNALGGYVVDSGFVYRIEVNDSL